MFTGRFESSLGEIEPLPRIMVRLIHFAQRDRHTRHLGRVSTEA
jgi:hypothetical protein